jgi:tetratricopeptide (TPR) repeat protein
MMKELAIKSPNSELCSGIRDGLTLLNLARGWLKQGNPVVAVELLKSAVRSPEAERDRELLAQILKSIGRAMMMQSEWEGADTHYLEAQRLFLDLENYKGAAECIRNRANMYFQKGKYKESEELCGQALEWATQINDYELRATILNTLGAIKSATGNLRDSIKIFKLCLTDFQTSGNKVRQGYVLLNIGLTQTELTEYVEAIFKSGGNLLPEHLQVLPGAERNQSGQIGDRYRPQNSSGTQFKGPGNGTEPDRLQDHANYGQYQRRRGSD